MSARASISPARTALQTVYDNRVGLYEPGTAVIKPAGPAFDIVARTAVNPDQIEFGYCPGVRTGLEVELRNNSAQPLCYKFKTSNPKRYTVTPSVGTVDSGMSASISIVCDAMAKTPSASDRHDRFLVKATTPQGHIVDEAAFWKAGAPGPCSSRKFGVALVEKIEEETEIEIETEDDTTRSMTALMLQQHTLANAIDAAPSPQALRTERFTDETTSMRPITTDELPATHAESGAGVLNQDSRGSGEEARLRSRVVSLESALSRKDVEMAALVGTMQDLKAQVEQRDTAMAMTQDQLERVAAAWRAKLEAARCEAQASKMELSAQLQACQAAVQRERASLAQMREERDAAVSARSQVEKEASLTRSLKQQHWEAVRNAEALRAEIVALRAAATGDMSAMQEASEAKSSEIAALTSSNESVKAALKEQKQEVGRLRRQLVEQTSAYESMVAQQQQAPEQQAKGTDETKVTGVGDKVLHGDEEQLPPMLAVEDEEENDVEDEAARLAKQQADAEIQAQIRNKARKPVMHSPPAGLLK